MSLLYYFDKLTAWLDFSWLVTVPEKPPMYYKNNNNEDDDDPPNYKHSETKPTVSEAKGSEAKGSEAKGSEAKGSEAKESEYKYRERVVESEPLLCI